MESGIKKVLVLGTIVLSNNFAFTQTKPNVIIILSDDQGWGDVGFNGCTDIPTPNLDKLAKSGVIFNAGYATHPYCSPSRAGLLSGRYQQHFGHESNIPYEGKHPEAGLPIDQLLISEILKKNGYQTCAIGKWHLGDESKFLPNNRGFDDWYGFSGGGRTYWSENEKLEEKQKLVRNGVVVPQSEITYLTDNFSNAAVEYIDKYSKNDRPFFMYLAYNAPHTPNHATKKYLERMEHEEDGTRAVYGAMVSGMDDGIGKIVEKLKQTDKYKNTLIFFYSDNGGSNNGASNRPFRGHKGMLFEGGIRVPFFFSWPAGIKRNVRYENPISALNIYPTILAATGIDYPKDGVLDGVNLIPYLQGKKKNEKPNNLLFWRYSDGLAYAVRSGDYKMIMSGYKEKFMLFNLASDPYEMNDLSLKMPEKMNELISLYNEWNKKNIHMKWKDPHPENVKKEEEQRSLIIKKACSGEK